MTIKEWSNLFLERRKLEHGSISLKTIRPTGPRLTKLSETASGLEPFHSQLYERNIDNEVTDE